MRKTVGTLAMAGMLLAATAGPALAHHKSGHDGGPPSRVVVAQAERQCEKQQSGTFIDLGGLAYVCLLPTGASERDIRRAERTCERAGGELFVAVGNVAYACVLPGGGTLLNDFIDTGGVGGGLLTGPDGLRLFPIIVS